jgi:hypothetical protein
MLCNIVIIRSDTGSFGAFVTHRFYSASRMREENRGAVCVACNRRQNADHVRRCCRLPVVRFNSIMPMGETLLSLAETYFFKTRHLPGHCRQPYPATGAATNREEKPADIAPKAPARETVRQMRLTLFMQFKTRSQGGNRRGARHHRRHVRSGCAD